MKNDRYTYKRVIFKMADGKSANTDIVTRDKQTGRGFRNLKRWKPFLFEGAIIDNLRMLSADKVDADSLVYPYRPSLSDEQMARMGVFG